MDLGAPRVGCRVAKSALFPYNWVDFTAYYQLFLFICL